MNNQTVLYKKKQSLENLILKVANNSATESEVRVFTKLKNMGLITRKH